MVEISVEDLPEGNQDNTFEPTDWQKAACEHLKIDWKDYKDSESLSKAIEDKGVYLEDTQVVDKNSGEVIFDLNEKDEKQTASENNEENKEDSTQLQPLKINAEQTDEDLQHVDADWIERKRKIYQGMAENGIIQNYAEEPTPNAFIATFEGGKITYTSETNVTVSPDSTIKAFEALLSEEDNIGRPIDFADSMAPEMKARLYAACVLHGNKMIGAAPSLEEVMEHQELLKKELGDERFNEFISKTVKKDELQQDKQNKFSDEDVSHIKQALTEQYELAQMQKDGIVTVAKTGEGENAASVFLPGKQKDADGNEVTTDDATVAKFQDIYLRADQEKLFLAEKFKDDPTEFKRILGDLVRESSEQTGKSITTKDGEQIDGLKPKDNEAKDKIAALREARKNIIKANMSPEQLQTRQEKEEQRDLVMAARLGIAPEGAKVYSTAPAKEGQEKTEIKKIEDDTERQAYADRLGKDTVDRLTAKYSKNSNDGR